MSVCRVTSCVEWRHVCRLTKLQTGTSGYKWRPGHRDIGNINDDWDTRNVQLAITIYKVPGHKRRPGHREYKWRPGHSKRNYKPEHKWRPGQKWRPGHQDTGNINDDRDTQREITDWDTGTTGTQGNNNNGDAGGHRGIYKWRRGHRECSISNHHQQSSRAIIRIMRYRSEYRLFFPWTIICCMFKSR